YSPGSFYIYPLSLHDALPIWFFRCKNHIYDDYVFSFEFFKTYLEVFDTINVVARVASVSNSKESWVRADGPNVEFIDMPNVHGLDRKSTRLNSSHVKISYAVF